jgi:hypothetical protein
VSTPYELVKAALFRQIGGHADPEHATFTLYDIERAFRDQPITVIHPISSATPMGRVQRNMLKHLAIHGSWDPDKEGRSKTSVLPCIHAADGLVARGFACRLTTSVGQSIYTVTIDGVHEAKRRGWV